MKKVILHIGCEKTGTTSIQNALFLNKEVLKKEANILYPSSLGGKNHWKLAVYSCDEDKRLARFLPRGVSISEFRQGLREEFLQEVNNSNADIIIISNEWLHPRIKSEAEFLRLKSLLHSISEDISVLLYIRRQDKMAKSLYSTALRAGNFKAFSFPKIINSGALPYYYDFLSIYRNWKSAFGNGQVNIRVFEKAALYKNDAVSDFFYSLNIDDAMCRKDGSHNFSINNKGVKLMRVLNRVLFISKSVINQNIARHLRHKLARVFKGRADLATEVESEKFLSFFDVSNAQLKSEYKEDTGSQLDSFSVRIKKHVLN